jgi:hypothetical protein
VTRAIEASDADSTPPVMETADGATSTHMHTMPSTRPPSFVAKVRRDKAPHFHLEKLKKFKPPTGFMDGRGRYNTPRDKRALFLANKYYKVQSAYGRYKVRKTCYHHQVAGNFGRAAPSMGRLGGISSSQVFFLHPLPQGRLGRGRPRAVHLLPTEHPRRLGWASRFHVKSRRPLPLQRLHFTDIQEQPSIDPRS